MAEKTLLILEVSRKQDYIFSIKRLRDNIARSGHIAYVTSSPYFEKTAPTLYTQADNFVYAGGGHTVLQFNTPQQAQAFAQRITLQAMNEFDGLELFCKQLPYCDQRSLGENLKNLSAALEKKKSLRTDSVRRLDFGVAQSAPITAPSCGDVVPAPEGTSFFTDMEDLRPMGNFVAVVHIDGNAMGNRVQQLYANQTAMDFAQSVEQLQAFSQGIQDDFTAAFNTMVDIVCLWEAVFDQLPTLPIRPVVLAGDDVCFLTAGSIGLQCAKLFLDALSQRTNPADGQGYAACAGIALTHLKYPFHRSYQLSEALCSHAKRYGAALDESGAISAMDWHIAYGELEDSLDDIRQGYQAQDGNAMTLRPVIALHPKGIPTGMFRTYDYVMNLCKALQSGQGDTARNKLKGLRTALGQGEIETKFYVQNRQMGNLLYSAFTQVWGTEATQQAMADMTHTGALNKDVFQRCDQEDTKRCVYFDAIELMDIWKEEG